MEKQKFVPQFLAALCFCLTWFAAGFIMGYSSPAIPSMRDEFNVTTTQESFIGSLVTLGCMTGGLIGGPLSETLGRKGAAMYGAGSLMLCGWLCIALAGQLIPVILTGRFICGIAVGAGNALVPTYIGECVSPNLRGSLSSMPQLMIMVGVCLCYIVGTFVEWVPLAWISLSLVPVFVVCIFLQPESPAYLLSKGRIDEAQLSMQRLRGTMTPEMTQELKDLEVQIRQQREEKITFSMLKDSSFLRPFLLCLMTMFFQQVSAINIVILFTVDIFESAGSDIDANVSTIIVGGIGALATLVSTLLADKAGRRLLLLISGVSMGVSLVALGAFFYLDQETDQDTSSLGCWLPLTSLMVYSFSFAIGYGPIPWVVMGEVFSPRFRPFAAGICTAFNWLIAFIVTSTFKGLEESIGPAWIYWGYGLINFIGCFLVFILLPETKGKSLQEIEAYFKGFSNEVSTVKHDRHPLDVGNQSFMLEDNSDTR